MAVLWQKCVQGTHYEVRTAGHSRRLYTDGVFHSQYNPKRPLTHGVWDLLMLPALYYTADKIRRVLVLGVGGGAVIQLLHRFIKPDEVVGVELNSVHINIAKRFFGISPKLASLHQADAIQWLKRYKGPAFDMIIDDLFMEKDGEPQRVVPLKTSWCSLLHKHTTREGVVVVNSMSPQELRESAFLSTPRLSKQYPTKIQLSLPIYENAVGAFFKTETSGKELHHRLAAMGNIRLFQKLGYGQRKIINRLV